MSQRPQDQHAALKTPEAAFLHTLQEEFHFAPRVCREVLQTAQAMLHAPASAAVRAGQVRLVVASVQAPFGPPLTETAMVTVTLTVDAGAEDGEVKAREGLVGLRRGRILRLLEEAVEQGGVLTQEDLARVLHVDVRTIRRDLRALKQAGHALPTRGQLKGVGRGQTHKVRIIELWLDRQGYDTIARWLHHSPQAIKRYVSTFLRVVRLQQDGLALSTIAFLTGSSVALVQQYLDLQAATAINGQRQAKLDEELARVSHPPAATAPKGGPAP